jgi:hypothetical protein
MATKIDEIVRVWLEFIFQYATEQAIDEKTKNWLKAAAPLADKDETSLAVRIISKYNIDEEDSDSKKESEKILGRRIEQLRSFREFNEELIVMFEDKKSNLYN